MISWEIPASHNNTTFATSFADCFTAKIERVHQSLSLRKVEIKEHPTLEPSIESSKLFCIFEEITKDQINVFAGKPSTKACRLDPIPFTVFEYRFRISLEAITTRIINKSLAIYSYYRKIA